MMLRKSKRWTIVYSIWSLLSADGQQFGDRMDRSLSISQLKRALNGHAFARGAVFGLRREGTITQDQSDSLHTQLKSILSNVHSLVEKAWSEQ